MYLIEKFNKFLNSDIILEYLSAEEIYNKHYSDIDGVVFREMILADPTSIIDYSSDGTGFDKIKKIGQYVKWIIKNYKKGDLKREDIYKVKGDLETYDMLKRKKLLDKFEIEKDINKFKSYRDLYSAIEEYIDMDEDDEELMTNTELEKHIKNNESKKVFEDDTWIVVVPETHRAACYYGKNTRWCTASKDDEGTFDDYNDEGDLYININKKTNKKFQFHFEGAQESGPQFMNEKDEEINFSSFFLNNPSLRDFYNNDCKLEDKIEGELPDGIGIINDVGQNFIIFSEWSNFSELFTSIDNDDYVEKILSGDHEDFIGYGADKYNGYGDVNTSTVMNILDFIQKYIKDNNITEFEDEYDLEYLHNKCDDLSSIYDFCNFNELTEIMDAINHAYSNADEMAMFNEAYEQFTDAIKEKFSLDDVVYDEDKEHYKSQMSELLNLFNTNNNSPLEIDYTTPYNGFNGDVKDDDLSEEVMYRLSEI